MRMNSIRAAVLAAAATTLALVATTTPSQAAARPARVGAATGLHATASKTAGGYVVDADWQAATNATAYKTKLVRVLASGGTALIAADTVTTSSWSITTTLGAGTTVKLTVTPTNGSRRGKSASWAHTLPDLTAPTGAYHLSRATGSTTVTLHQDTLADDLTTTAAITRRVDWGDGAGYTDWATGTALDHPYPALEQLYEVRVEVTDQAGNAATYPFRIRILDDEPATGAGYTAAPGAAFAAYTRVTLTETAPPTDNFPSTLTRVVAWGDGTTATGWDGSTPLTHRYAAAGSYTPTVTVTDDALNTAAFTANQVAVTLDTVAPRVRLTLPTSNRNRISSWTTLKGRATDINGTGVKQVQIRAIQKRGTTWYSYKPVKKIWVRSGTRTVALSRAPWFRATLGTTPTWSAKLTRLRTGTLLYQARGTDRVANVSTPIRYMQTITRR